MVFVIHVIVGALKPRFYNLGPPDTNTQDTPKVDGLVSNAPFYFKKNNIYIMHYSPFLEMLIWELVTYLIVTCNSGFQSVYVLFLFMVDNFCLFTRKLILHYVDIFRIFDFYFKKMIVLIYDSVYSEFFILEKKGM